jgi:hypothetical protein
MKTNLFIFTLLLSAVFCLAAAQEQNNDELEQLVYSIKYADTYEVRDVVRGLLSPRGSLSIAQEANVIIINDLPEFIAKVSEALKAVDVKPDNILLSLYLFWAEPGEQVEIDTGNLPDLISEALQEASALLPYKKFTQMGGGAIQLAATANRGSLKVNQEFSLHFKCQYSQHSKFLLLRQFSILHQKDGQGDSSNIFSTDVTINDGEVTVAGVTRPNGVNKAIVCVVMMDVK